MKFSENWLREWVDPPVDTAQLCRQLTMAGLEVDSIVPAAPDLDGVVVGRIETAQAHPQADKLTVCSVDCGEHGRRQIVCGAPNVVAGLRAPVALPGGLLPGGQKIARATVRGVESDGMLCSGAELGLAEDAGGLLALDPDAVPGVALAAHLGLDDQVIDIDLTPNRGDCLSLLGVAREVALWNRLALRPPSNTPLAPQHERALTIAVDDNQACPAYAGRVITGIDPRARTPDWLRERLRRGGIRAIHPVVDVTNYVMLELGQPMHAFDLARLEGGIEVRRARAGEALALLDGGDVVLDADTLVIADASGPVAMAGVMGGAATAVAPGSEAVFLESACFAPAAVAGQGRRYKRHTDSLHRFERGVDATLQVAAIERATALILEIAGGQPGPVRCAGQAPEPTAPIRLRGKRIERLLGVAVGPAEVVDILERLGMGIAGDDGDWQITPPPHRYDLTVEADLIEEVARIHGYDNLPSRVRRVHAPIMAVPEARRSVASLREVLLQRGYAEAITYSFVDPELQRRLDPDAAAIDLDNPIAQGYAQMRSTLWSGLLPAWRHNRRRQQRRVRLFEIGLRFARDADAPLGVVQRPMLAGIASGPAKPTIWDAPERALDFFDIKGDVEALASTSTGILRFEAERHPALHPGRCARLWRGDTVLGWLGQLHPDLKQALEINELPYLFEVDYENIAEGVVPRYKPVPEYPEVRRDLALTVPEALPAGDLIAAAREAGRPLLQSVEVFDVFRGGDLDSGFKSIALGLIFQDKTRTLTNERVEDAVACVAARLEGQCQASIRGR